MKEAKIQAAGTTDKEKAIDQTKRNHKTRCLLFSAAQVGEQVRTAAGAAGSLSVPEQRGEFFLLIDLD